MRVARFSWALLVLALFAPAGSSPPDAHASAPPDSAAARSPAATIHLESGDTIQAAHVRSWGQGTVRYEAPDGSIGYISHHRITRILDAAGTDQTRRTLDEGRPLGRSSGATPPSLGSWLVSPLSYRPTRDARSYTVTEFSVLAHGGSKDVAKDGTIFSSGIGGMANLSRTWAVGGVAHLIAGGEYKSLDVGARARCYLGDRTSFDATLGSFTATGDGWTTQGLPVYGEVAVTFFDAVSWVTRAEASDWRGEFVAWGPFGPSELRSFDRRRTVWRTGVRVGPSPKWIGIPGVVFGTLLFLMPRGRDVY